MPLLPPKRNAAGYFLASNPPLNSPEVQWDSSGKWAAPSPEWLAWATMQRKSLLGELLSHGTWFSRPPRQELLDPLLTPWAGTNAQNANVFLCNPPPIPGDGSGKAVWQLQGLNLQSASITPVWKLTDIVEEETMDAISLFGDVETVDGDTSEMKEIQIEEITAESSGPIVIRNREWETRKFLAKERVREARLKAQIAMHIADKEYSRFLAQFGDLDDNESHFSEYDLTDDEDEHSEESK
jgi:hypothetical protein